MTGLPWIGTGRLSPEPLPDNVYFGHKPGSGAAVSVGFVPRATRLCRYLMLDSSPCERFKPDRSFRPDRPPGPPMPAGTAATTP